MYACEKKQTKNNLKKNSRFFFVPNGKCRGVENVFVTVDKLVLLKFSKIFCRTKF